MNTEQATVGAKRERMSKAQRKAYLAEMSAEEQRLYYAPINFWIDRGRDGSCRRCGRSAQPGSDLCDACYDRIRSSFWPPRVESGTANQIRRAIARVEYDYSGRLESDDRLSD